GDDVLIGGLDGDVLYGGTGNDAISGDFNEKTDSVFVDEYDGNVLDVSEFGGNDILYGEDGDDYLFGGAGHDVLLGGLGADKLFGDQGPDYLYGNAGDDHLYGGSGNDTLSGGTGNDYLDGGSDVDWLFGNSGNDFLFGGGKRKPIEVVTKDDEAHHYSPYDDVIDYLFGGTGADSFKFDTIKRYEPDLFTELGANEGFKWYYEENVSDFNSAEDTKVTT
ncbi:MAG: hypothetical protein KDB27_35970, partial [Planctomycetales bacterium]|nr:hypothetical protein [Planctomycetales bacterium]